VQRFLHGRQQGPRRRADFAEGIERPAAHHGAFVLQRPAQDSEHNLILGTDASEGAHGSRPDKLVHIVQSDEELRNGRGGWRTHATQVQGGSMADLLVLIRQQSADGTHVFLLGAELCQCSHGLLLQRRIAVLQLP
jgi:hypothetical protein